MPPVGPPATDGQITRNRLAILATVLAWAGYLVTTIIRQFVNNGTQNMRFTSEAISYLVIVTALTFSALAYLLARQGALYRSRSHRRVPRAVVDESFGEAMPTLTVLVPSYREDARVIRQTLLSAALQEYPFLRIVLLIDDPPTPTEAGHRALLDAARALPAEINETLSGPRETFDAILEGWEGRADTDGEPTPSDLRDLAVDYRRAVAWLHQLADRTTLVDHTDRFFADHVVRRLAADLETTATALQGAADTGTPLPWARVLQLARRLAWVFRAEVSSFERKQYVSLSDEANKAMNLNSYIGLMGGSYAVEETPDGTVLRPSGGGKGDLEIPEPDYVLTLDADSVLLPEYCLRLVHLLERPEHRDVAVAQTPYSSYPGSGTRLERLAGATTDLQHILHQGMTHYDATFWVGANAVLRKRALDDIEEVDLSSGWPVRRYIQDRTVIEDTESSIDLAVRGWKLVNYPERLSYSATPPDFGSLCIQRQRWANGGLLILPKLWRHMRERRHRGERGRLGEAILRVNYMASIFWSSIGLIVLLAYPYSDDLLSPLVVLAAGPYFAAMASDLRRCGYKRTDVLRIYGFNLILLPVNLSGAFKSLGQGITGKKIAFARTPKVRNRTTAPLSFVVFPYLLIGLSVFTLVRDLHHSHYAHAVFAGINATLAGYALLAYIGVRNSIVDVWANLVNRLYRSDEPRITVRRARRARRAETAGTTPDWAAVLYHGSVDVPASVLVPPATVDAGRPSASLAATPATPAVPASAPVPVGLGASASIDAGSPEEAQALLGELLGALARSSDELVLSVRGPSIVVSLDDGGGGGGPVIDLTDDTQADHRAPGRS